MAAAAERAGTGWEEEGVAEAGWAAAGAAGAERAGAATEAEGQAEAAAAARATAAVDWEAETVVAGWGRRAGRRRWACSCCREWGRRRRGRWR